MRDAARGEKVSIIGAGSVGSMLAQLILEHNLAHVMLIDIDDGIARGKAYDLQDASHILGYGKIVEGTSDFSSMSGSDIVVITAGFPRKPGMSREDLLRKNGAVISEVSLKIKEHAPDTVVIVVTNPLDAMSYLVYKTTGFVKRKVMGMAGVLDSARCSNQAAIELGIPPAVVDSMVIGTHDTNMVPLFTSSRAQGMPFMKVFNEEKQCLIEQKTKKRGAEIVSFLKSGSAFFAPGAACFSMVKSIIKDEKFTLCASAYLEGEYGYNGFFIGVPVILGRSGIEKIIELEIADQEKAKFKKAAEQAQSAVSELKELFR